MTVQKVSRRHSIGMRIIGAFLIILALLLAQGWLGLRSARQMATTQREALDKEATLQREALDNEAALKDRMLRLMAFREQLGQTRIKVYALMSTKAMSLMETLKAEIAALFDTLGQEAQTVGVSSDLITASQATYERIIALHWDFQTAQAQELLDTTSQEEYTALFETLEAMTRQLEADIQITTQQLDADMQALQAQTHTILANADRDAQNLTLTLSIVGFFFAGLAGWLLARSIAGPLNQVVQAARRIAGGDLSTHISVTRKDELGLLQAAMQSLTETIRGITGDLSRLTDAAQKGELGVRADGARHQGEFARIMQGMNDTLDAIIGPLNIAAEYIASIAQGDLPVKIHDEYHGDFNEIKHSLNTLIDVNENITQVAETIARGDVIDHLPVRSDHDRLMAALNQLIDASTETTQIAEAIASGNLEIEVRERTQNDRMMQALNRMVSSLQEVARVAEAMSTGNLDLTVRARSDQDTFGQALNAMLTKLNDIFAEVKAMAEHVSSNGRQMSASAEVLSQTTAQQAAAAEEASASMEQMASNIRQNSENARQTEKMALESLESAREGGVAVAETVVAMKGIETRISMIQEIAMQTNILSMNATIEAAKAQNYGKGFAVVASEVRSLAGRSREAADEIEQLVRSCVTISERAGMILERLVPNSERTADLVQEIAAASSEQSIGAEQVNRAIQQLDAVTQQNAATADQMASSAEELSAQANRLHTAMEFFTVREHVPEDLEKQATLERRGCCPSYSKMPPSMPDWLNSSKRSRRICRPTTLPNPRVPIRKRQDKTHRVHKEANWISRLPKNREMSRIATLNGIKAIQEKRVRYAQHVSCVHAINST
jgi:methyl-accepting chemotaxis protein